MKTKVIFVIGMLCFLFFSCNNSAMIESNTDDRANSENTLTTGKSGLSEIILEEKYQIAHDENENNYVEIPAWVVGKNINFREEASLSASIISRLSAPQKIILISMYGDWAFVKVDETQGYIHSDFISFTEPSIKAIKETPTRVIDNKIVCGEENNSNSEHTGSNYFDRNSLTIAIDAGHQAKGNNEQEAIGPGATITKDKVSSGTSGSTTGVPEYKLTLDVSLKLRDELIDRGYNVFMIRETHNINISNKERANMATHAKADIFVRVHADGSENSDINGIMTLSPSANNPFIPELYESSFTLSELILENMVKATEAKNRGVLKIDNMGGINWSTSPVTIIEMGLMTNPTEDALMQTNEYQLKLVTGIANGIDEYFCRF
jgi:N-acetylmuramoyl-L-alanine amidase